MNDPSYLAQLFPEGIYLIPEKPATPPAQATKTPVSGKQETPESPLLYKGENKAQVVVLYESQASMDDHQEEFLLKILAAVGLTQADIALVNIQEEPRWQQIPHSRRLVFGCPSIVNDPGTLYQLVRKNGTAEVSSDSLENLISDKSLKTKLWQALKKMFDL